MRAFRAIKVVTTVWLLSSFYIIAIYLRANRGGGEFEKTYDGEWMTRSAWNEIGGGDGFADGGFGFAGRVDGGRGGVGGRSGSGSGVGSGIIKKKTEADDGSGVVGKTFIISDKENNDNNLYVKHETIQHSFSIVNKSLNTTNGGVSSTIRNNDKLLNKILSYKGFTRISVRPRTTVHVTAALDGIMFNTLETNNNNVDLNGDNGKANDGSNRNNNANNNNDSNNNNNEDSKWKEVALKSKGWTGYLKYKEDSVSRLWPKEGIDDQDRVLNQILYHKSIPKDKPKKLIYMAEGLEGDLVEGQSRFVQHQCRVNWCTITEKPSLETSADLVYHKGFPNPKAPRPINSKQVRLLFLLESPLNTPDFGGIHGINWTASYRSDSVINAPYERFTYFQNFTRLPEKASKNYALGKTKKVAWFVSNCYTNNGRGNYASELSKYIDVDIYGFCGDRMCRKDSAQCFQMLKNHYKFYLSFENSNCKDYITEKFFTNALRNDVVPVVMGARIEDYERLAPPESFIHVDSFKSPQKLAKYLHEVDQNDALYNSYFRWKGSGEMIDTKFWCRLCHMLHALDDTNTRMWYGDINAWWRGDGICLPPIQNSLEWSSWRPKKTYSHSKTSKALTLSPSVHKAYRIVDLA